MQHLLKLIGQIRAGRLLIFLLAHQLVVALGVFAAQLEGRVQLTVTEPTPVDEATPSQTQQKRELLRKAGAEVELRAQADPTSGQLRSEFDVRYHPHATPGGGPSRGRGSRATPPGPLHVAVGGTGPGLPLLLLSDALLMPASPPLLPPGAAAPLHRRFTDLLRHGRYTFTERELMEHLRMT
jgi:hypothetical protein